MTTIQVAQGLGSHIAQEILREAKKISGYVAQEYVPNGYHAGGVIRTDINRSFSVYEVESQEELTFEVFKEYYTPQSSDNLI